MVLQVRVAAVPAGLPAYDRDDWKHWTDQDGDCQDTRQEVLLAESTTGVAFRTDRRCRVATGRLLAPYSATVVTDPGDLDVDHMVPLANAHQSGAWDWTADRRELYANYLENPEHLIAVTARANRSKGARGPDQWKPEDRTYWCQYAIDWVTIKSVWDLTVTGEEHDALRQMLDTCSAHPFSRPPVTLVPAPCPPRPALRYHNRPRPRRRVRPAPPRQRQGPPTTPARPLRRLERPWCRAQRDQAAASPSGWCPAPGTGMGTEWCANGRPSPGHSRVMVITCLTSLVFPANAPTTSPHLSALPTTDGPGLPENPPDKTGNPCPR